VEPSRAGLRFGCNNRNLGSQTGEGGPVAQELGIVIGNFRKIRFNRKETAGRKSQWGGDETEEKTQGEGGVQHGD